ncbi:UDP-3-O-(3-hydroxymyristoyl)glucosamine N-acyltransferase [Rufibacter glacialis]|uniref:UDP-3-O-acylglucosamine N-acyltransferase n=1 Tax=Rufibacter glacialis TaxID=1259555 RepID=A0A5M8QKT8_9BACT|nr:UDP-3-O-(3-hydroxymyristoyl)glucosamine N-acyltransferase [Rufibacter glacialis]KAA6435600.1 UDP-3-O-(3-hydroxymyristoyl)glucosamine N-acyltransferase [Rufibacter glacialis]GGK64879.1 UDP-3-O-acylglucosamine N-acyltransferase [Rufibacter glacialis]
MEFTVQQIADLLQGQVQGDGNATVNQLAKIEEGTPGALSFLSNAKYEPFLYTTGATAVIVSKTLQLKAPVAASLILVEDPYSAFSTLLEVYQQAVAAARQGVEEPCFLGENSTIGERHYRGAFSYIGKNCKIGQGVHIYPNAYIGDNVTIGDNTVIYAGVKIYPDTVIGSHCTLNAGCVIGSDGFGFAPQKDGTYKAIPQTGNVVLGDHVRIGANTTVDCATMGSTLIGTGTKIDNLVQVAHNVEIGKHTVVAAQTAFAGSSKVGNYCTIAGQVGVVGHVSIADRTIVGAKSGISKNIKEEGTFVQGAPAFDYKQNLRAMAVFRKLPELQKQVDELREKL